MTVDAEMQSILHKTTKQRRQLSDNQSPWKIQSLNRVFSGLADHYSSTSLFSLFRAPFSWLLWMTSFRFALKGYSTVRYVLGTLTKEVQLFPGLGLYSGIFALYLQCPSKKFTTTIILFYAVCLLYVLSTVSFIGDLVGYIIEVSNKSYP